MNRKQLLISLSQAAQLIPAAGPIIGVLLTAIAGASDADLDALDAALLALPTPGQIDAADARIYAEELAKKLLPS